MSGPGQTDGTFLEEMIATRLEAIEGTDDIIASMGPEMFDHEPIDLFEALCDGPDVAVIAEVKKASPSLGPIDLDADPAQRAMAYEAGGAAVVSVLAEPSRFSGSFEDIARAREATSLPVLCKDFVVHHNQLLLARAAGADAVLLMVSVLGSATGSFLQAAREIGLSALVEVHDEAEYAIAAQTGARIIGVNARDLHDLSVDVERSWGLVARAAAEGFCVVAESGMRTEADVRHAAEEGARAVLVGEALMRAEDPEQAVRQLAGIPACRVGRA